MNVRQEKAGIEKAEKCYENFFDIGFFVKSNKINKQSQKEKGYEKVKDVAAENYLLNENHINYGKTIAYYMYGFIRTRKSLIKLSHSNKGNDTHRNFKGKPPDYH